MRRYSLEGLGGRVREARKAKTDPATGRAMSQGDLAKAVGVSLNTISEMERGRIPRDPNLIIHIADVLGVGHEWLMGDPDRATEHERAEARRIVAEEAARAAEAAPPSAGSPLAAHIDPELANDPKYWRGRQDELVNTMEHVSHAMRQATAMHDRALATQREIIANTMPVPHGQLDAGLTEREREFLAIMRRGGEELRARLEREAREALETQTPPPDGQGRRASGE